MQGTPVSLLEREEIALALTEDRSTSWAEIARRTRRHSSTTMREVEANGGRACDRPAVAERRAGTQWRGRRQHRLEAPGALRDRVTTEFRSGRSPEAMWVDLLAEEAPERVCVESIYQAILAAVLEVKVTECLWSRRPYRRHRRTRCDSKRPGPLDSSACPNETNGRSELGHWEADQIIGVYNRSSMLWRTERVTRFSIGVTMRCGYAGDAIEAGLVYGLDQIPSHLLASVTFDQGSEWACWETIIAGHGIDIWFCDPHSPWQRGQAENFNPQWSWWLPRAMELGSVSQGDVVFR